MGASEDELIGIPFPEHSSELLSSLNEQRHRGLLCDVTIVTQGLEYRTHRAVLAACSHYFRKLFTSKPYSGQRNVCELDFIQPPVLAALLEFAYTATLTISSANMREVLRAARVLEIQCVADACLDILRCSGEGEQEEQQLLQQEQQLLQQGQLFQQGKLLQQGQQLLQQQQQQQQGEESASAAPLLHHHHHPGLAQEMPKVRRRKRATSKKPPRITLSNRGCLYRIVQPLRTSNHKLQKQQQRRPASPARDLGYSMEAEGRVAAGPEEEEEEEEPLDYRPLLAPPSPADREGVGVGDGEVEGEGDGPELDSLSASFPFPFLSSLGAAAAAAAGPASPDSNKPGGRGGGGRRKSQMPQECPICHKVIHGAGKLPRHMRTHTGEKPFACEVCAVRFTRNDKLKIHMRKHTGERPYCCNCCDARFLHSYDLKNHARLHTGDRPFECSQCRKAFVRLDHLQRHLKGQNCLEVRTRRRKDDDGGGGGGEDDGAVNGDSADGKGADGGESGAEYGTPVTDDGSLHSAWSRLASAWDQEPPEEMAAEDSS